MNQGPHGGWSEEIQAGVLEERTSVNRELEKIRTENWMKYTNLMRR